MGDLASVFCAGHLVLEELQCSARSEKGDTVGFLGSGTRCRGAVKAALTASGPAATIPRARRPKIIHSRGIVAAGPDATIPRARRPKIIHSRGAPAHDLGIYRRPRGPRGRNGHGAG